METNLNKEQQFAVDTIEGAVYVAASAGTGKTTVLASRVEKMLMSVAQINSENILCLTFTDIGAINMRQKLIKNISSTAYKIGIHTFHSFSNDIIQNRLDYFGVRNVEPVSELEKIGIIKEIIDKLPINHILKRLSGDIYYEVGRLTQLFQFLKEEHYTKDDIEKKCDEYLENLPFDDRYIYKRANKKKEIKVGDVKKHLIASEKEKMDKLIAGAYLLEQYNAKLTEIERFDFSDLLLWVIKAFENNENFLRQYQEKYQYLLVDEVQDTNRSQMRLLNLLIDFWPNPNIFCVGDLQQTIYEFSGSRLQNILDFQRKYNPVEINLKYNYRSNQQIIDYAANLIRHNEIVVGDVDMIQGNPERADDPISLSVEYKTVTEEEMRTIEEILELIDNGVNPCDIAVIYRKHKHSLNIIKEFQQRDIPINIKRRTNILDLVLTNQIVKILNYIETGENLHQIAFFNFFNLPIEQIEKSIAEKTFPDLDFKSSAILKDFLPFLYVKKQLKKDSQNHTLLQLMELIFQNCNIIEYINNQPDRIQKFIELTTFFDFVKAEVSKNSLLDIKALLSLIENLRKNSIGIPVLNINYNEEGINFLTCHGAKGTEFDYVFMIKCTRNEWEGSRGNVNRFKLPETITKTESAKEEQERRLFYVAMTRARKQLIMSYSCKTNDDKGLERSQFIDESEIKIIQNEQEPDFVSHLSYNLKPEVFQPALEKEYIAKLLEFYRLSPSALNLYLKCPVQFYYQNIIKVPYLANEAGIYGTAIHVSLQRYYNDYKNGLKHTGEWLFETFRSTLAKSEGILSKEAIVRRTELGKIVLLEYYDKIVRYSNKITLNEFTAKVNIDDIPVKVIVDKIEFDGEIIDLVDYKTGNYKSTLSKMKPDGDVYRQMKFCKLAMDEVQWKSWKVRDIKIAFVTPEKKDTVVIKVEDEQKVRNQIKEVYQKIKNQEFSEGCGECEYCKLNK